MPAEPPARTILGISAYYHDAAAAVVRDGQLVAAAQEERFSRTKHDPALPLAAMAHCLDRAEVEPDELDVVVYYDKPITTFVRILRTALATGPRGFGAFRRAVPTWTREKLWIPLEIERGLAEIGYSRPQQMLFTEHHESHAASAFYPSPFESAAVLTFDGVGEWTTASIGHGRGNRLDLLRQLRFPHSIGLLYSAFTYHCGFEVNSGEYKLMGLAPYGTPRYAERILDDVVDLRDDGSFTLDLSYFAYLRGTRMTSARFESAFGPARRPDEALTGRQADLARSVQEVVEQIVLRTAHHAAHLTGESQACLAGGVALNCVSNARLLREGPFDEIWVQPAAGDAGGAIGSALFAWHQIEDQPRVVDGDTDSMAGSLLGPAFSPAEIGAFLEHHGVGSEHWPDPRQRAERVAGLLADGAIVAVLQDRMEMGPRALGSRSILADPRSPAVQARLNAQTKRREGFRPFAPVVLEEKAGEWFDLDRPSRYMTLTVPVRGAVPRPPVGEDDVIGTSPGALDSPLPAVTHVDGSARVQTVSERIHPGMHQILVAFDDLTGCPVVVNTSFNVKDEPIVCTPDDALRCFRGTEIDALLLEDRLIVRADLAPSSANAAP